MITLLVLPNFKGNTKQFVKALIVTILIDAFILLGAWVSL